MTKRRLVEGTSNEGWRRKIINKEVQMWILRIEVKPGSLYSYVIRQPSNWQNTQNRDISVYSGTGFEAFQETFRKSRGFNRTTQFDRHLDGVAPLIANPDCCNSTSNKQNSPIQQNCCYFWTNNTILISFNFNNVLKCATF